MQTWYSSMQTASFALARADPRALARLILSPRRSASRHCGLVFRRDVAQGFILRGIGGTWVPMAEPSVSGRIERDGVRLFGLDRS
jgi:hypothetical protein